MARTIVMMGWDGCFGLSQSEGFFPDGIWLRLQIMWFQQTTPLRGVHDATCIFHE